MMKKFAFLRLALLAGLIPNLGFGNLIGEPGPALLVKEWVAGGPMSIKPGTNIYVLEVWGASIPASRDGITNLTRLQERFKTNGVVVIALSDATADIMKELIKNEAGTNLPFAVALDDQRKTALSYMTPVKQRAIPYAFVVGTNGNVLWHGPPMRGLGKAVERITAGQYDFERARKSEIAGNQMEQYLGLARRGDFRAKDAGVQLLAYRTNDVELLCDMAYVISTVPRLPKRDLSLAGEALDQADKLATTNPAPVMIIRAVWLFESGKADAGLTLATQAVASARSPMAKTDIEVLLHTLQARAAQEASRPSKTNRTTDLSATNTVSDTRTNHHADTSSPDAVRKP